MRSRNAAVVTLVMFVMLLGAPVHAADPEVVLATDAFEYGPAATDTHLAWTESAGRRNVVYVMPFGGAPTRVSEAGTDAWTGSIDGSTVTFQQAWFDRGRSDIYRFDVTTALRSKVGAPVSTRAWEYDPAADGEVLAFARLLGSGERRAIVFFDGSDTTRTIATTSGDNRVIWIGQVNGNWVVFEKLAFDRNDRISACDVYRHDIAGDTTMKVPNPSGRCQYSPSVDETGTVFFARSGFGCGLNVQLRAYPEGGPPTTLVELRDGHDLASATFAVDNGDSTADVYYDGGRCSTRRRDGRSDISKVTWIPPT
jgi:hypothetical protein